MQPIKYKIAKTITKTINNTTITITIVTGIATFLLFLKSNIFDNDRSKLVSVFFSDGTAVVV